MIRWRRGEKLTRQGLPRTAAPEELAPRILDAAHPRSPRPASPASRGDAGPDRPPGDADLPLAVTDDDRFHVEHGEHVSSTTEGARRLPSPEPDALAWRWRRGQRGGRPMLPGPDEHQAVTVRTVGVLGDEDAPGSDPAPTPRVRRAAPTTRVGLGAVPREELERARLLATGARQQPPEDAAPWARIAAELRRP